MLVLCVCESCGFAVDLARTTIEVDSNKGNLYSAYGFRSMYLD